MLRIMKISNFFRIFVYKKQTGNWVTIALTSCANQQNKTINNKYSQQDLVSSSGMKILLVEDEGGKSCPFCFGALGTILKKLEV